MYSTRPGTEAARNMKDTISPEAKKARLMELENLQSTIAAENNGQMVGTFEEVLVEGKKDSKWYGRTKSNKLVFFKSDGNHLSHIVNVKITSASAWSLQGEHAG